MTLPGAPDAPAPPGFWRTLRVLLGAARRRAEGRRIQQRRLFKQKTGKEEDTLGCLGVLFTILVALATHGAGAIATGEIVKAGQRLAIERQGGIVVDDAFIRVARRSRRPDDFDELIARRAAARAKRDGTSEPIEESHIRNAILMRGAPTLVAEETATPGLETLATSGLPALLGSLALLVWSLAVVLQGEGLEVDVQRRRHPMWEWLFSHPVPPGAVFLAEMLAPIAANPIYWTAPLYPGILYGQLYGIGAGFAAAALVGVPVAIAAACLGKGLEATVMLRASLRSRGALIGLMSWAGFAASMGLFFSAFAVDKVAAVLAAVLAPLADLPWPWLAVFLGQIGVGVRSFPAGVLACLAGAGAVIAGSVAVSVWAADAGLTGRLDRRDTAPRRSGGRRWRGGNPLYRKELTWFVRDRSALVQAILIPLTLAGVQLFNLRGLFEMASHDWTYICGGAVVVGTYFLSNLGPKSLVSEGATLWLALTWPCSLENLLKAKARLWALLSSGVVGLALAYALWLYPAAWLGIGLVGLGWLVFSRSMAEKAVTLATVTSDSGEVRRVPAGRQWAVLLGTLSFATGILTRQWPLALVGIVYSWLTAAAMWQNFRARLPFLLDPWSEKLPPAPTLMHAMIAISCLVDGGAVLIGLVVAAFGRGNVALAFPLAYGAAAAIVALSVGHFLSARGVDAPDVWLWRDEGKRIAPRFRSLMAGAAFGLALGAFGCLYVTALRHLPWFAHLVKMPDAAKIDPNLRIAIFAAAVGIAPTAEEYLFRGLLFRALDREWGGWRAVAGSAVFFASYHPALAWLPVGLLGALNAMLFKRTGRLGPAVLLHATYNAIILGWQFYVMP